MATTAVLMMTRLLDDSSVSAPSVERFPLSQRKTWKRSTFLSGINVELESFPLVTSPGSDSPVGSAWKAVTRTEIILASSVPSSVTLVSPRNICLLSPPHSVYGIKQRVWVAKRCWLSLHGRRYEEGSTSCP